MELVQKNKAALLISQQAAQTRQKHYQMLYDHPVSEDEQKALNDRMCGINLYSATTILRSAGAALNLAPNIFGVATGGMRWGALLEATAWATQAAAEAMSQTASIIETKEHYRRRRQDWEIQSKQAAFEADQIRIQLEGEALQLSIAQEQLQQTQT